MEKQYDKGYSDSVDGAANTGILLPMLASNGALKPSLISFPIDISVKIDGVRCLARLIDDEVTLWSRGGKRYLTPDYLEEAFRVLFKALNTDILDGELYRHGVALQDIVSIVKKPQEDSPRLKFMLFDVPNDQPWMMRKMELVRATDALMIANKAEDILIVPALTIHHESEMVEMLDVAEESGYEGVMLRTLEGYYLYNHRSADLIKVKNMQDSEALVVSVTEDKNGEGVLTCDWNGVEFSCKMRGSHETRTAEASKRLIGSYIKFKYQTTTNSGAPQFPVGLHVRELDKEGNPVD